MLAVRPSFGWFVRVGRCGARQDHRSRRPVKADARVIRDTFRRQGLFVGSGGPYNPGPATHTPLLATGEPLDDDLSSP
jgi:hypothetical protein